MSDTTEHCHLPLTVGDRILALHARKVKHAAHAQIAAVARIPRPAPNRTEYERLVREATARAPVLRYRVTGTGWRSRFGPDPRFNPLRHLEFVHALPGRAAEQCLQEARGRPLPKGSPLWSLQVVHGYAPNEHIVCLRMEHTMFDGMGALQVLAAFFAARNLPAPSPQPPPDFPPLSVIRRTLPPLHQVARPPARWLPAKPSRRHGLTHHTLTLDVTLYRDIKDRTGATTAQVSTAALAGALRAWAPQHWGTPLARRQRHGLRTGMTLNVRHPLNPSPLGNHVGVLPVTLPCPEADPLLRLEQVMARVNQRKKDDYRRMCRYVNNLAPVPAWLLSRAVRSVTPLLPWNIGVTMMRGPGNRPTVDSLPLTLSGPVVLRPALGVVGFMAYRDAVAVTLTFDHMAPAHVGRLACLLPYALTELHARVSGAA
ncbi:wax ester/triacylglycerol synthase domain-containing protein [Streptomyces rectiverticillatus]|uniref:wax ester/triacylglycerol synthase domain-containing protein n=1 Tax=Streptomyces rectiverticillatus TaxID=173860 RepID=UPI0015C2D7BE|nr:wax ester/triacylglycerol synthase domain-containing protein [Streptomyces rectiverticillatus]